ncbi:stealth conserved region 3 domain-containing protein [Phaeovulum sp. NW3]|uniref:stealth conserved region 3 domain-containing protein n=1 Tax=Phaeovulum sp. NW3 TaxID=2934933 RepID=UPI0020201ACF|nr:stealth conserved region 3 domain-containing protein [Phaeovulum sp. NW3]MCL7464106.1 Stealth CR1 domain-containing protein [Phaeovulum sp. NW3]
MIDRLKRIPLLRRIVQSSPALMALWRFAKNRNIAGKTAERFGPSQRYGIDHGYDMVPVQEALVRHFCSNGCAIRTIFSPNAAIQLICYKHADRNRLFSTLATFQHGDVRATLAPEADPSDHRALKPFYFIDGENRLGTEQYALDPWLSDEQRIYTHTRNNLVSSVARLYQERTPLAAGQYFLQGDTEFNVSFADSLRLPEAANAVVPFPVDLVLTWVDGADPAWRAKRQAHSPKPQSHHADSNADSRFRDREELRYALRSVHCFGRFIRNIYLVTDDQVPHWLDRNSDRITIISHREIFPDQSWLPVFNSHAIEANLHRISGLAEHFLYMNDDLMFWNKCRAADFFDFGGNARIFMEDLPNIYGEPLASTPAWRAAALNVNRLMIERFGATLYAHHLHVPFAMRKSVMEQIWQDYPAVMAQTSRTRFRSHEDVSPASFFHPVFAYLTGQATLAGLPSTRISLGDQAFPNIMERLLRDTTTKSLCINDADSDKSIQNGGLFTTFMSRKFSRPAPWENDQ